MILLYEKDYISMETLANRLFLSKSMLNRHMDKSWRLRKNIEVSPVKGLKIPWSERQKRNFLAKYFFLNTSTLPLLTEKIDLEKLMQKLYHILQTLMVEHHYYVSGLAFTTFYHYLLITIIRQQQGFTLEDEASPLPVSNLMNEIALTFQKELQVVLTEADLWSCQSKLNELNVLDTDREVVYNEQLKQQLQCFCQILLDEFGIRVEMNEKQEESFVLHMHKLKIRKENDNDVANFEKRMINTSYPLTAQLIRDYFLPIFQLDIPESEISYIIPYFAGFIEEKTEEQDILYISDSTPSLIHDSLRKLEQLPLDVKISWKVYPQYYYEAHKSELQKDVLMVLTTELPIVVKNSKALLLSKILVDTDLELVKLYLSGCLNKERQRRLEANEKKYLLPITQVTEKKALFEILQKEELGNYHVYDLVMDKNVGYFAAFTQKSSIHVYTLTHPVFYKDHFLKKVVVANYCVQDKNLHSFFEVVRPLLLEA
jgi:transcriptional antiterminator